MLNEPLPRSVLSFFNLGKKGIPKSAIISLASTLHLPLTQMADMLNISYKTLSRKSNNELMDSWVSGHAVEIATVVARGLSVFEDPNKLNRWLRKPNRALGGNVPLELLQSPVGIRLVIQILGRIEEGVFS
jgi:putative toxin-antitoxin system antitoxin component (TIGR02293 family)